MDILKLNSISAKANTILSGYNLTTECDAPVGILVRSFNMNEWTAPESLIAVARAGAGVNNIPCEDYAKKGICVFNTPGANANAVKELVIASMLLAARNLYSAMTWAQTLVGDDVAKQVEKGKARFAGSEILGKTLSVLGLGAIGRKVASAANALGMKVVGYDPFLSETAKAEIPFVEVFDSIENAYKQADYVTLHMPYLPSTKNLIDCNSLQKMKDGVVIINAARGELVNIADVKSALESGKVRSYVVDFPNAECIGCDGIIATPHLGASTEEAEDNCAVMAAQQLKDYLEKGVIRNSVNMPALDAAETKAHRISIISVEGTALPYQGVSASKNGITYTLIDSDDVIDTAAVNGDGIIKVRTIF